MNKAVKIIFALIVIFLLCGVLFLYLTGSSSKPAETGKENQTLQNATINSVIVIKNISPFKSPYGTISINAKVLGSVSSLPVYHGVLGKNDSIDLQLQPIFGERQNVTTPEEAPEAAKKAMEPYGGLPSDAVFEGASTSYSEVYDGALDQVVSREPMFTTVSYSRDINGLWIVGDSNSIKLTLGTNGELLWLFKVWRNYTYTGDVPLIPVNTAIDKLQRGDVLEQPDVIDENITIDSASPGYYAKTTQNNEAELEPIWMLFGNTDHSSRLAFYVYARQFANFTASPTVASPSEEILFSDLSDASPTRWFWDFGDGTNSTLRNPPHAYQKSGTYNVTLTVWNDLGSDTFAKADYITVLAGKND
jgi:PKD repeat protein